MTIESHFDPLGVPAPTAVVAPFDREAWPLTTVLVCGLCRHDLRPWQPTLTRRFYACGCILGPVYADLIEATVEAAVIDRRTEQLTLMAVRPVHLRRTWQQIANLHRRRFTEAALVSVTVFGNDPGELIVAYQWREPTPLHCGPRRR
ncbi:MAG TPA: hypothetical protein VK453_13445 [Micromonosporaceae bacterium]|nr:hypothetical protein [Micromonosporaceae bacterium]